ncbi:hypothetical protein ACJIZ3_021418 [Penstemon smallii]|uniref:Uncharacterized protein n=1 Tax=Penstemon smallii TaxID=265156 RepID=A0ABD3SLI2_9LAMI
MKVRNLKKKLRKLEEAQREQEIKQKMEAAKSNLVDDATDDEELSMKNLV